jgi:hypothetical protein
MERTLTSRPEVLASIEALTNPGEKEFLNGLLLHLEGVVIRPLPANVASIKGDQGFAAGTLESTLATIRHDFSDYDVSEDVPAEKDDSLMGQLRLAGLRGVAPGERRRRLHLGLYASEGARKALKGIVALASIEAARRDGVKLPRN